MDKISIINLSIFAFHGVYESEKKDGQSFYVDCDLYFDTKKLSAQDDITDTIDYGEVSLFINDFLSKNCFNLIESAVNTLADELMLAYQNKLDKLVLTLKKPFAPIPLPFENITITVQRQWATAYLSIGSNMGDRESFLNKAINGLNSSKGIIIEKTSSFWDTKPYGLVNQNNFINACLKIKTFHHPEALLKICNQIESENGRLRTERWGQRTLDIDILSYSDMIISTEKLTLPHIDMHKRLFVLEPLAEIERHYFLIRQQKFVCEIISELKGEPK